MITELTQEQTDSMPKYRDEYLAIGLNCDRIDYGLAEQTVRTFLGSDADGYEFVYCKSPKEIPKSAEVITYGANESYWVAYYKFFNDHFKICPEIEEMVPIVNNCHWVMYSETEKKIYLSDRPVHIKMDDQNLLHCEDGPAITFTDGFSVYAWHGTRVPSKWIEDKDSITAKDYLMHSNIEMRRVASEIVGWAAVLDQLDAQGRLEVIDDSGNPSIGKLVVVDIPDVGKEKFLLVECGTKRQFALSCDPKATTAFEAQAMGYGIPVEEFEMPEIRT